MGKSKYYDPKDDQEQAQAQAQAELQAQLQAQGQLQGQGQGQGQGQNSYQGQGQTQYAGQAVDTSVWNSASNLNGNANGNLNGNGNLNANGNLNYSENENNNENNNENTIKNHVENKVDTEVNVDVDIDLGISAEYCGIPSDDDVIDIDSISGISQSIVMPDVVDQYAKNGSNFNLDQVNNLTDNDTLSSPSVSYSAGGLDESCWNRCDADAVGDFSMTARAVGGTATSNVGSITGDDGDFSGIGAASAAASVNQEAFTQNIAMGANIQFNSVELQVVGGDINDAL